MAFCENLKKLRNEKNITIDLLRKNAECRMQNAEFWDLRSAF